MLAGTFDELVSALEDPTIHTILLKNGYYVLPQTLVIPRSVSIMATAHGAAVFRAQARTVLLIAPGASAVVKIAGIDIATTVEIQRGTVSMMSCNIHNVSISKPRPSPAYIF